MAITQQQAAQRAVGAMLAWLGTNPGGWRIEDLADPESEAYQREGVAMHYPYTVWKGNNDWCLYAILRAYHLVGFPLHNDSDEVYTMASSHNFEVLAKDHPRFAQYAPDLDADQVRPGDILLMAKHGMLVESVDHEEECYHTIEGNVGGQFHRMKRSYRAGHPLRMVIRCLQAGQGWQARSM